MALKENYKDDILDVSVNTKRKYRMTENADGTISLDDETVYTQEGDSFGASDMNATNGKVNALETDIGEINDNLTQYAWRDGTATTLEELINGFVASSVNTLENGQTKSIRVDNRNNLWFNVTITRDIGGSSYTGIAISTADASVRYTFRKLVSGGASTVISPFSGTPTVIKKWFGTAWSATSGSNSGTKTYTVPSKGKYLLVSGGNMIDNNISYINPSGWTSLDSSISAEKICGANSSSSVNPHSTTFVKDCDANEQISFTYYVTTWNNTGGMEVALIKL